MSSRILTADSLVVGLFGENLFRNGCNSKRRERFSCQEMTFSVSELAVFGSCPRCKTTIGT